MAEVALIKCKEYEFDDVYNKIKEALNLIGGINFVKGKKILLKPNVLSGKSPDKGVTTNPIFLKAVIRIVKENGGDVYVGDSPGLGSQDTIYNITGIQKVVDEEGAKIANFKDKIDVDNPEGKIVKKFTLVQVYRDVDYIISLPKLKTHGMLYYTGAMKNMFGMIPGLLKAQCHFKFPDRANFSEMLLDLNCLIKPSLAIMDAVIGMEGNGPGNGTLRNIGLILASRDFAALDATACRIIGLDPSQLDLLRKAAERNYGEIEESSIKILGEKLNDHIIKDFQNIKQEVKVTGILRLPDFITRIIRSILVAKPFFIHSKCVLCNECVKVCPSQPKSLRIENKKVVINRKTCIRCFCCQELCPKGAIIHKRMV